MKTQELKAILAIAEELQFTRAAERLGIAQPQLSELIRRIEDHAGFVIFNRRPRVSVTLAGEVLVASARRVLKELESASERGRAIASGRTGQISLGFVPVVMASDLAAIVRGFLETNPNVELQLVEGSTNSLQDQMRRGDLDFVITRQSPHPDTVQRLRYAYDEVNLMVSSAHRLAKCKAVEISELQQEKLILFPRSAGEAYHDGLLAWCRSAGWTPRVGREIESWMAVAALVGAGFGISLGTQILGRIAVPGVTYRPILAPPLDVSFWMSWAGEQASPLAERFVQHVRASIATRKQH